MTMFRNEVFKEKKVQLDGNEFVSCTFDNSVLVYSGGRPPMLNNCSFNNHEMVFEGVAANTIQFMKAMSHPHSGMQRVVKDTFAEVFEAN